ncbi:MAG: hypothetical protein PHT31_05540 [Candidatus Omnitrophica bacterium]|nr:hypothetical protein [Candidatus Omnitrophota bacterium]MDD5653600.1 hypothetical protein [Candidatus Omnitrophota bacterium]
MKKISVAPETEAVLFVLATMLTILSFFVQPVFAQEDRGMPYQQDEQIEEVEGIDVPEDALVDLAPRAEFKEYDVLNDGDIGGGNVTVFKPEVNIIERQIDQEQPSAVIQTEYIDTYEYRDPEVQNIQPEFKAIEPLEQSGPSAVIHTRYEEAGSGVEDYESSQGIEVLQPEFQAIEPLEQGGSSAAIHSESIPEYKYEDPATEGIPENQDYGMQEGE